MGADRIGKMSLTVHMNKMVQIQPIILLSPCTTCSALLWWPLLGTSFAALLNLYAVYTLLSGKIKLV